MEDKALSSSWFNFKQPAATKALHNHLREEMNLTDHGSNCGKKHWYGVKSYHIHGHMGLEFPLQHNPYGRKRFRQFYSLNKIANPKLSDEQPISINTPSIHHTPELGIEDVSEGHWCTVLLLLWGLYDCLRGRTLHACLAWSRTTMNLVPWPCLFSCRNYRTRKSRIFFCMHRVLNEVYLQIFLWMSVAFHDESNDGN